MNSTRWVTLTEFCKYLGRAGIARVDETEKGWFIAWIDSSPKALAKQVRTTYHVLYSTLTCLQEAAMKKERSTTSDEQRERLLIAEQIERAKLETETTSSPEASPPVEEGLKREEGSEKVVLSFSAKPAVAPAAAASAPATALKMNPLKPKTNPLKAGVNPLKRPNPLKASAPSTTAGSKRGAETLGFEDQETKRRKMDRDAVAL
jgi:DNA/RNA-binding protein KIN17